MSDLGMSVGECYKSKVTGGYEYAIIVADSGSGMYRADTVRITNRGFDAELNQHIMHWQFREYEKISKSEFDNVLARMIDTIYLIHAGDKRNNSRLDFRESE